MLTFPEDFDVSRTYVVELVELGIGRRLYVRPADAPRSCWFQFETVPILGLELLTWSRDPEVAQFHESILSNGLGFADIGGEWLTEQEWREISNQSVVK